MKEGLHQLFEARARIRPEATALRFGSACLSYRELDRRTDELAGHLRLRGVEAEASVGLCVERSLEMVVGLLGILKAGGAYVPLDPEYPRERLSFMWRDFNRRHGSGAQQAAVLVTLAHLAETLPAELVSGELVRLDADRDTIAAESVPVERRAVSGGHLAYVIYTSGSTGRPKGVLVAHGGVVNLVEEATRLMQVDENSRWLQLATLSFDASVLEIFTILAAGGCLVLTRRQTLLSGEALGRELRRHAVTTLAIPPSLLDKVPEEKAGSAGVSPAPRPEGTSVEFPALRSIVVGGEACSAATAARWATDRLFLNAYAPTEATIFTTAMPCRKPFDGPPAMGWPIRGTQVHVLDSRGFPVADGEVGELAIGGLALARGYLGRFALTAERFVPDPFSTSEEGGRLYRSGDLARRRADGSVEFVGRSDTQVKVRGLRIELGEIESVLGLHPEIVSTVVDLRAESRLVAYAIAREAAAGPNASELRAFLAAQLPEAMVPSAFVYLDAFPRTPTGKVDRTALPAPGHERPELAGAYVAPRTHWETSLAAIWGDLLSLEKVGVDDNLFELGGHSLIATQIVTRVREELGRELALTEVFEKPTVAELACVFESSDTARRVPQPPPISPAPRNRPIPLSFPQERVWFLLQLAPHAIAYNFQFSIRWHGELDLTALEQTLDELVRRHEVLRTTFPALDGRPVQVIHPEFEVELPFEDLTHLPPSEREAEAERRVRQDLQTGFDVTELPLLRWRLLRIAPNDHLLLQVEHHFVHDGWSLAVYLRELLELYEAFAAGKPSPLAATPVQYADFAVWQREWMRGEALEHQLAFWSERLADTPPLLELPADRPRPRLHSFRGGCLRVDLPAELYTDLRAFSRRRGMTLFLSMLAGFDTLMYRYAGQRDLLLGSGLAARRLRELEHLVGMVVNTLVLRATLSGGMRFGELLEQVRSTTLETHLYQDLPFEKLVERLQPERDLSRNPLFQVLFSFHDAPVPDLELPGLSGELFEWHNGSAKSELNVVSKPVAEQRVGRKLSGGEQLTMVWEYSADIFDAPTIERMWGHYQALLRGAIEDADRPLGELPMLPPAELRQLEAWHPAAPDGEAVPVHELFVVRAAETPGALAVADASASLSYGELHEVTDTLAGDLRELGVGPEKVVAILTGRSREMVLAALAVLKAGGAYLPLDPAYPRERLSFMIEDSGAVAVLARAQLRELLGTTAATVLVLEDQKGEATATASDGTPPPVLHRENLAYVIYTSGSTGTPKGVELTHGGLANLVAWHLGYHGIGTADRSTLLAGPAFDASVWEIWPYLATGASLHVADAETRGAPERLLEWMSREGITRSFLATPLAEAVMEASLELEPTARPETLTTVLTGGDRLDKEPDPALGFRLVNHYGPTENTVVATAGTVEAKRERPGPPPIGRPIAGTRAYVADRDFLRTPIGVPGELLLAGRGLARGYRGGPALTAALFVPDPWGGESERLYRTGDLVRYLPDGDLEFLGRIDSQVQVRGFRVELGEVHAHLVELPVMREAEVLAREVAGELALVAYVAADTQLDVEAARGALGEKLPDYMVPAIFVQLPELPLTPNGKVDRRALPEPDTAGPAGPVAPHNPLEELVAGIWARILERDAVGVHDGFFDLGGHSLLATRVLARLRDATGVELALAELFEAPTVAGLARAVDRRLIGAPAPAAPIPRRTDDGPTPLTFAQERLWFLDQLMPRGSAYNIARTFELRGALDTAALSAALDAVAQRHGVLRTTFESVDGRPVQVVSENLVPSLEVIDAAASEVERLCRESAARPFRLDTEALLRTTLLRLEDERHVLLLAIHHIVADGWSMAILTDELATAYAALAGGQAPDWVPLPVRYGDFAAWQRERLRGESAEREVGWWREHLRGAPRVLQLPTDRPRPKVQGLRGGEVVLALPPATATRLHGFCGQAGATPFMTLLAAFAILLGRYSGQRRLVVGTPVAGRGRSEVEGLVGFFVNPLALHLDLTGEPSFRTVVERGRTATLGGHAHQEVPFEKLVEELAPERSLGHSPLFQVLFTVTAEPPTKLALDGLETTAVPLERCESRFDLEVSLRTDDAEPSTVLRYDTDLFDRSTAEAMTRHFHHLLEAALAEPGRAVARLELMDEAEKRQVLEVWSAPAAAETARPEGEPRRLDEAFLLQARRTPDAPALIAGTKRWTYRDLEARVHQLAHELRRLGVGPEVAVAVLLERNADLVAALLAVMEAGGFYVPLDPAYPRSRTELILADTRAPVILTHSSLADRLASPKSLLVRVDTLPTAAAEAPPPETRTSDLAYVIYTSGSTGRPKGVAIEHRSAAAMVRWAHATYSAEALRGVLAATSVCFDLSAFELFVPLTAGGTVVLARDALALAALPDRDEVTLVNTVPSAMAELLRLGALPTSARTVNLAGEPLRTSLADELYERVDQVFDLYGPSEDTTYSTFVRRSAGGPETVGRPIAGTRAYLVDRRGEAVPSNVPGRSASAATVSPAAICGGRQRPPSATCRTRSARGPESGSTARVTWPGGSAAATWSSSAGSITR